MQGLKLIKQMGNARFYITRSCFTLESYRLACKINLMEEDRSFEERKFTVVKVDRNGTKIWYLGNKLHRRDGPAVERVNGEKAWFFEGKRHRVDGPAVEWADGIKEWYFEDKKHRVDGPAVEYADGRKEWWFEDKKHCVYGPAVIMINEYGTYKEWWVNGKKLSK